MQTVPEKWNDLMMSEHIVEFKAVISDVTYTYGEIKSASIQKAMMDKLTIGQAVSAQLDMVFVPQGTIPTAAEIKCYIRLASAEPTIFVADELGNIIMTDDGYILAGSYSENTDWIPFGTFYIDTRATDAFGWMTITAYDRMLAAEQEFPSSAGSMDMDEAVSYIADWIGVEPDERNEIAPYSIDSPVGVYTMREVLCGIAAASGGNFVITENNKLRLISLSSPEDTANTPVVSCNVLGETVTIGMVTLYPDSETQYTSGSSGYEIQADCIYATQGICNHVKNLLRGVTYLPYSADTAFFDPALELGDSVKPNGNLSVLASATFTVGVSMSANIEAPIDTEVNHEYPYQTRSKEERKIANSFSEIKKTTEQIALSVNGKVDSDDVQSAIDMNLNSLSLSYQAGTNGAALTLSKDGVSVSGVFKVGSIDASQIDVNNLNADNITAGELSADRIKLGGDMTVYRTLTSTAVGGYIGYTKGDYGGKGIHMMSGSGEVVATTDGAKICYGSNNISVSANGGQSNCDFNPGGNMAVGGSVAPSSDGSYSLGYSGYRWSVIFATSGTINTSDEKEKKDISYDLKKYDELFDMLKPASYRLKNGESGRTHTGLIAQDVEKALEECDLSGLDFAAFVKSNDDGVERYGLRYSELISLCIRQIQMLKQTVNTLEERIANLEGDKNG